jgi:hypothetical protein
MIRALLVGLFLFSTNAIADEPDIASQIVNYTKAPVKTYDLDTQDKCVRAIQKARDIPVNAIGASAGAYVTLITARNMAATKVEKLKEQALQIQKQFDKTLGGVNDLEARIKALRDYAYGLDDLEEALKVMARVGRGILANQYIEEKIQTQIAKVREMKDKLHAVINDPAIKQILFDKVSDKDDLRLRNQAVKLVEELSKTTGKFVARMHNIENLLQLSINKMNEKATKIAAVGLETLNKIGTYTFTREALAFISSPAVFAGSELLFHSGELAPGTVTAALAEDENLFGSNYKPSDLCSRILGGPKADKLKVQTKLSKILSAIDSQEKNSAATAGPANSQTGKK